LENQHRKISGYRELSQEEIDLMNDVKSLEDQVGSLVRKIQSTEGLDHLLVDYATKDLKQGFMWLVRAIAQPATSY
jgi:hypothetical protein